MPCKTTRNKGTGRLAVSCILLQEILQNVKYSVPKDMYCSFGIPSSLVLSIKNKGMGGRGFT